MVHGRARAAGVETMLTISTRLDQFDGAEKEVIFTFRNGSGRQFTGQSLLLTFSVPQFFFHVTTAYDILRYCGVDLVKKDFLGTPDRASQTARTD